MFVRLLRPWLKHELGAVLDLGEDVNRKLVGKGMAEPVTAQEQKGKRAATEPREKQ